MKKKIILINFNLLIVLNLSCLDKSSDTYSTNSRTEDDVVIEIQPDRKEKEPEDKKIGEHTQREAFLSANCQEFFKKLQTDLHETIKKSNRESLEKLERRLNRKNTIITSIVGGVVTVITLFAKFYQ